MNTVEITIRSIQHYLYCPHRWGLIEINKVWAENAFVTKANLMHDRVHDPEKHYAIRGKKVYTAVPVYHDGEEYNLYGVLDCLEVEQDSNANSITDSSEKRRITIVEYKPRKPKNMDYNQDDLMQVYAQKICVDYVFGSNSIAEVYYADVRKRIQLPLEENRQIYDEYLKTILQEMRNYLRQGKIPPIRKGQKCSGCSMKDLCIPNARKSYDLRKEIMDIKEK